MISLEDQSRRPKHAGWYAAEVIKCNLHVAISKFLYEIVIIQLWVQQLCGFNEQFSGSFSHKGRQLLV